MLQATSTQKTDDFADDSNESVNWLLNQFVINNLNKLIR